MIETVDLVVYFSYTVYTIQDGHRLPQTATRRPRNSFLIVISHPDRRRTLLKLVP